MKIKDLYGLDITITDLERAIGESEMFSGFGHIDPSPEQSASDNERKEYWTDLHEKLLQLQSNLK
jgi:hypothetical protein